MKTLLCSAAICAATGLAGAVVLADDNFPLYRDTTAGLATALSDEDEVEDPDYAHGVLLGPGEDGIATATASIIPARDAWVTLAQTTAGAAGIGDHASAVADAYCTYIILDNAQHSPYGEVLGLSTTLVSGGGQSHTAIGTNGTNNNGFMVNASEDGLFVIFNGDPITIAASGGILEFTLPASPGDSVYLDSNAGIGAGNNGDLGSASAAASVVPVESLPTPKAVVRDSVGDIVDSWEYTP